MATWRDVSVEAGAGAMASVAARAVIAPLDVIKIRLQLADPALARRGAVVRVLQGLWREEGLRALYRGNAAGMALYVVFGAVQFPTYDAARTLLSRHMQSPSAASTAAGCVAGAAATLASYPLDLARTHLAAQGVPRLHQGVSDVLRAVALRDGARGLFAGLLPALIQIVPAAGFNFVFYESARAWGDRILDRSSNSHVTEAASSPARDSSALALHGHAAMVRGQHPWWAVLMASGAGVMAGAASKLIVFPLDTTRRFMQASGMHAHAAGVLRLDRERPRSMRGAATAILAAGGVPAFWRGAVPAVLKSGVASSVTFATYEALLVVLGVDKTSV